MLLLSHVTAEVLFFSPQHTAPQSSTLHPIKLKTIGVNKKTSICFLIPEALVADERFSKNDKRFFQTEGSAPTIQYKVQLSKQTKVHFGHKVWSAEFWSTGLRFVSQLANEDEFFPPVLNGTDSLWIKLGKKNIVYMSDKAF